MYLILQIVTDVHLFQEKTTTPRHDVIMMFNHAGFSDNALLECVYLNRLLFLW